MHRIDAHQHFWNYNDSDYVWMNGPLEVLARDFLPDNLKPLLDKTGFDGTVAVQARQMVVETEYLLSLSDRFPWIFGVVGWFDFTSDSLESDLDRLGANPKLSGVRELIHDMPDADYAVSDPHVQAIAAIQRHGLTYDLLLRPQHVKTAIRLVDRFPGQPFVIDHIAKPDIEGGVMEPWRGDITELAKREHVCCKLSGMVTEADWSMWSPEDLHPYIDVVLEAFGPGRLMIGSDWPVCTCAGEYSRVMKAAIGHIERLSDDEKASILGETCRSFYGLEVERRV